MNKPGTVTDMNKSRSDLTEIAVFETFLVYVMRLMAIFYSTFIFLIFMTKYSKIIYSLILN